MKLAKRVFIIFLELQYKKIWDRVRRDLTRGGD